MRKTVDPEIGCMIAVRIIGHYDPWHMLSGIFCDYHLNELRKEFWDMYLVAMLDERIYPSRTKLCDLMFLYQDLNDVITSAFILARRKGLDIQVGQPELPSFPMWERFEHDPLVCLKGVLSSYAPHEICEKLWDMLQAALTDNGIDQTKEIRRKMIALFEHLTDLVTAGYAIVHETKTEADENT